jgi:hypothetical protein
MARIAPERLRALDSVGEPLAALLDQFERELAAARLADRTAMIAMASAAIAQDLRKCHTLFRYSLRICRPRFSTSLYARSISLSSFRSHAELTTS